MSLTLLDTGLLGCNTKVVDLQDRAIVQWAELMRRPEARLNTYVLVEEFVFECSDDYGNLVGLMLEDKVNIVG